MESCRLHTQAAGAVSAWSVYTARQTIVPTWSPAAAPETKQAGELGPPWDSEEFMTVRPPTPLHSQSLTS